MLAKPSRDQMIRMKPGTPPLFWVTVDTEEDFDWTAPFARDGYRLDSLRALPGCQQYFAERGVKPIYLVDWAVLDDDDACAMLAAAAADGSAEIGAQLHPWVTPPFDEELGARNSYTGNLPDNLQREKLLNLRNRLIERIGAAPRIYRAGRYGLGKQTAGILKELGFVCDTSVRSGFDYRGGFGPDYRWMPLTPWWVDPSTMAIEVPLTTVFVGALRHQAQGLYHRFADGNSPAVAALARLGMLERIALTPEGIPAERACRGIDEALALGLPLLNFSFHSPSLAPGNTPYVRSANDLTEFYRWWDIVLAHLAHRGVKAATLDDLITAAEPAIAR